MVVFGQFGARLKDHRMAAAKGAQIGNLKKCSFQAGKLIQLHDE